MLSIDPKGDVVLKLGNKSSTPAEPQGSEIRVSSTALSYVSPVFAALFGPNFFEGQALSCEAPTAVSMPDDDCDGMVLLMKLLHHRYESDINKLPPSVTELQNLAIVADKYDCVRAVQLAASTWFEALQVQLSLKEEQRDWTGLEQMLVVAYLLDLPKAFQKITKQIILRYPQSYTKFSFNIEMPETMKRE